MLIKLLHYKHMKPQITENYFQALNTIVNQCGFQNYVRLVTAFFFFSQCSFLNGNVCNYYPMPSSEYYFGNIQLISRIIDDHRGKECVSGWIFTEILSHPRFKWCKWWDWGFLSCWDWLLYDLNYLGMLEWDECILMYGGMNFREPKERTVVCRTTDPQRYICFNHQTYEIVTLHVNCFYS